MQWWSSVVKPTCHRKVVMQLCSSESLWRYDAIYDTCTLPTMWSGVIPHLSTHAMDFGAVEKQCGLAAMPWRSRYCSSSLRRVEKCRLQLEPWTVLQTMLRRAKKICIALLVHISMSFSICQPRHTIQPRQSSRARPSQPCRYEVSRE